MHARVILVVVRPFRGCNRVQNYRSSFTLAGCEHAEVTCMTIHHWCPMCLFSAWLVILCTYAPTSKDTFLSCLQIESWLLRGALLHIVSKSFPRVAVTLLRCRSNSAQFSYNNSVGNKTLEAGISLLQILADSGKFHPGQIILTDLAFALYHDLHLTVTEVIDHGLHHIVPDGPQLYFKELLPACLAGRESAAFNNSSEVVQLSNGFHDAPALPGPMCICFCNISMPQVRSQCCRKSAVHIAELVAN